MWACTYMNNWQYWGNAMTSGNPDSLSYDFWVTVCERKSHKIRYYSRLPWVVLSSPVRSIFSGFSQTTGTETSSLVTVPLIWKWLPVSSCFVSFLTSSGLQTSIWNPQGVVPQVLETSYKPVLFCLKRRLLLLLFNSSSLLTFLFF